MSDIQHVRGGVFVTKAERLKMVVSYRQRMSPVVIGPSQVRGMRRAKEPVIALWSGQSCHSYLPHYVNAENSPATEPSWLISDLKTYTYIPSSIPAIIVLLVA